MDSNLQRRLREFVDRKQELHRFTSLLGEGSSQIIVVSGEKGTGKTSLLLRMTAEATARKMQVASICWTETRNYDTLAVMRKIRDDLGAEHFKSFTELLNYFTVPGYSWRLNVPPQHISVADSANIKGSSVGDVGGIIIKDCMFTVPREDVGIPVMEQIIKLSEVFVEELTTRTTACGAVIFLDGTERMSAQCRAWFLGEIVKPGQEDRLANVTFVISGRSKPKLDYETSRTALAFELCPLTDQDVLDYLGRRGISAEGREDIARLLMLVTKGNPLQIAVLVDGLLQR